MLSVNKVSVGFGGIFLFEDISFLVNRKDRIGLTGKNGAGKSTLLKMLSGYQLPDSGTISMQNGLTTGYLAQEIPSTSKLTVMEETRKAFSELNQLTELIDRLNEEVVNRTDYESESYNDLLIRLHDATERYNLVGGYNAEGSAEKVLQGLGFTRKDFNMPCSSFSGGWRMRIELAKILLQQPDLLLLDEPTNHLDIESIQWLEDFLKDYFGAIILVSHDKAFLDNITNRTIEISLGKIYDYKTNYSNYVIQRKERREQQLAAQKNQQKFIEHTEELINKFRAKKDKAAFAQSLIKKLDRIEIIEVDDEENSSINFRFPPAPHAGKVVLNAQNITKQYGEKLIFKNVNIEIERGQKVALVGKNGEGKSTFLKIIAGETDFSGSLQLGHQVDVGYFAQNQAETLNPDKTVFEIIDDVAVGEIRKNIRSLLGSFLFSGDTIEKKVKVLSGGEKNRLALCKLLLHPFNLLILDEPTNHLDMRSKEVLKNALIKYDGTLIIVSHDRDFLEGLTENIFYFNNQSVKPFIGTIYQFLDYNKLNSLSELETNKINTQAVQIPEVKEKHSKQNNNDLRKEIEKEIKKLNKTISETEKQVEDLENRINIINQKLSLPETISDNEKMKQLYIQHGQVQEELEKQMHLWENIASEIEFKQEKLKELS
ncbi:MAG: ABC-F family ATP-binding cassette domain-containing protein [Bacteroidia bacterium]|nr:ABC-F family ATP-binding cassette domain-containing protein [Bacteroidia bacterium]MCZ2247695.1 ABC-F family ATP-binding cassette domain-containing protein [Bacteroidia bacterium]